MRGEEPGHTSPDDLARDLRSSDLVIRERACRALIAMGSAAVPRLVESLADPVDDARREAARALSALRDAGSAPALVAALEDDLPGVRWLAAEGLIGIGHDGFVPLLQALMRRSDSVRLRQGAHRVLLSLVPQTQRPQWSAVLEALEGPAPIAALPVAAFNALKDLV